MTPRPQMITRSTHPDNLESPFHELSGPLTPASAHYVRSHFPVPTPDTATWALEVGGLVARPLRLTLDDLRAFPAQTRTVTMECAGNGRVFLQPRAPGVAWALGAVSTAEWTGARLGDVLRAAELRPEAADIVLDGLDRGVIREPLPSPGEISYARSVPRNVALDDVVLAYAMNGEPLSPQHGFPLRAIVPGWYGMASVKWLGRVWAQVEPFRGYFQTVDYTYWEAREGQPPELVPLSRMQVKAQIAWPAPYQTVPAGEPCEVRGAAWSGAGRVVLVEVSADGGQSWHPAEFLDAPESHVWRRWHWVWTAPQPGPATLLARATDDQGQTQPLTHDLGRGAYMINFPLPVPVTVVGGHSGEA